jgi:hypothetical protein
MIATTAAAEVPAVLVQMFTSEGCSSCLPADVLLAEYVAKSPVDGVTVVLMALHVDYWNQLGWADAFSSPVFSAYQRRYRDAMGATQIYTPQMIVDGRAAFVGSDRAAARKAIEDAAKLPKAQVSVRVTGAEHDPFTVHLTVNVQQRDALPADQKFDVMLAVTEDDLTTSVRRGENAGRTLHHDAVVRLLRSVGQIARDGDAAAIETELRLDPHWRADHLHVVAFVQSRADLRVYGVAAADAPARNP